MNEFEYSEFSSVCDICKNRFTEHNSNGFKEGAILYSKLVVYRNFTESNIYKLCSSCTKTILEKPK